MQVSSARQDLYAALEVVGRYGVSRTAVSTAFTLGDSAVSLSATLALPDQGRHCGTAYYAAVPAWPQGPPLAPLLDIEWYATPRDALTFVSAWEYSLDQLRWVSLAPNATRATVNFTAWVTAMPLRLHNVTFSLRGVTAGGQRTETAQCDLLLDPNPPVPAPLSVAPSGDVAIAAYRQASGCAGKLSWVRAQAGYTLSHRGPRLHRDAPRGSRPVVRFPAFVDCEGGAVAYELAVGTAPFAADVLQWVPVRSREDGVALDLTEDITGPVYVTVMGTDAAGLRAWSTLRLIGSAGGPPPSAGVVTTALRYSSSHVNVTVDGFNGTIAGFEYCVALTPAGPGLACSGLPAAASQPFSFAVRVRDAWPDGRDVFVTVRAVDADGLWSAPATSPAIVIERTPPDLGVPRLGLGNGPVATGDVLYTAASAPELQVHWDSIRDPDTEVVRVDVAVGTAAGEDDVLPFRAVPAPFAANSVSLRLPAGTPDGARLHVTLAATNAAGLQGMVPVLPAVIVDTSAPYTTSEVVLVPGGVFPIPAYGAAVAAHITQLTIRWDRFKDPQSGIQDYEVVVGSGPTKVCRVCGGVAVVVWGACALS